MIREYEDKDFDACKDIVNNVWEFDDRFEPQSLADFFKQVYTGASLGGSSFAVVAEDNNQVVGFLFGVNKGKKLLKTRYSGLRGQLKFIYDLFSLNNVPLRKKFFYLKILNKHELNRREVEPKRDNEVNLFAVRTDIQGRGYGKALMNQFIEYCKENSVNRITLDTDTECNIAFYEKMGFGIKGEFYSPLQKEYSGKSGQSFVYEKLI